MDKRYILDDLVFKLLVSLNDLLLQFHELVRHLLDALSQLYQKHASRCLESLELLGVVHSLGLVLLFQGLNVEFERLDRVPLVAVLPAQRADERRITALLV